MQAIAPCHLQRAHPHGKKPRNARKISSSSLRILSVECPADVALSLTLASGLTRSQDIPGSF